MYIIDKVNQYSMLYPEIKPLFYDILRTLTMQTVAQLLFSMNNPNVAFMNSTFIQTTLYLCIGVASFWMVVYKFLLSRNAFGINI
jgi:hypothetical protein